MTNPALQDSDPTERLPAGVRFAGKSLEQVLHAIAGHVIESCRHDVTVAVVVRDQRGRRIWGSAVPSPLAVVATRRCDVDGAVEIALDQGRPWRGDDTLAAPIGTAERISGAIVLTAAGPRSLDASELRDAQRAAAAWALTIDNALAFTATQERTKNLELALQGRAVIEQAKGIVMERHHCGAEEAFGILRDRSQREDLKLSVVAAQLVADAARRSPI